MTQVLITIDTELAAAFQRDGMSAEANFESSVLGRCAAGDFGIFWLMERMEAHGLRGVFFVDPMPALVHGIGIVARIVEPILARGHEAQLHIHTEWLAFAPEDPVAGRRGQSIGDFGLADQRVLLALAADLLERAGAPRPIAFRAGNYGANDDTLTALAELGIAWDSSFNPAYLGAPCRIGLPASQVASVMRHGVGEVPVAAIEALPGKLRHAQVCAMSAGEMRAALDHAAAVGQRHFAAVSHSFEMLSRDRRRPNRMVMARFEALCAAVAADARLESAGFGDLAQPVMPGSSRHPRCHATEGSGSGEGWTPGRARGDEEMSNRLPSSYVRTLSRIAQQAAGRLLYERA